MQCISVHKILIMNKITISSIFLLLAFCQTSSSQKASLDTTVTFFVAGICEMCEQRIEEAAKVRGVTLADWSVMTRMLKLTYNPRIASLPKIQNRILAVGHDLKDRKANNAVYKALDECCLYRDEAVRKAHDTPEVDVADSASAQPNSGQVPNIQGVVMEEDAKGQFKPLEGATVTWLGSGTGTTTNATGVFRIALPNNSTRLVVSYTGYRPDTLSPDPTRAAVVVLAKQGNLQNVVVSARQRSSYISAINAVRTQMMTEKELFKAACCNLSESFETNPSVDVSFTDAVTGNKQIQLLGLGGVYTQLTVENLPGPRGLAIGAGLNYIPGTWVEGIQLTKGTGSVANGFESIAGQINVEMKKPETADQLYANMYVNSMGKTDLNLNLSQALGKKWHTALLLHDAFLYNKMDFNGDGFRDLPTGNLFTLVNRWKYEGDNGLMSQFGFKVLTDEKTGGQNNFDPEQHKFGNTYYGLGINTRRYESFAKIGYVYPEKKYQSIGLQLSGFRHLQDAYYGTTVYGARQDNLYANLIYQGILGSTAHKYRTGLSLISDKYDETLNASRYRRTETVPGAFAEYTYDYLNKLSVVAGLRGDYNNLFGWFATPRMHIRYNPAPRTSVRLSLGRGQRTANILAENSSVLVSARHLTIIGYANGKAYGLNPEVAWNKGISIDQKLKLFGHDANVSLDFFRNDFSNQNVVDLEDPRRVRFYDLDGKSYSNSLQAELNFIPVKKFDMRLAYRFFDVKTTISGALLEKPFNARHRAFANLGYEIGTWKFDYTVNFNSSKRVPSTQSNPPEYRIVSQSPSYWMMNAQISKTLNKAATFEAYMGGENLTNFFQKDAIISAANPFTAYFDASLVWGPVSGRMFYVGMRWKVL